MIKPFPATAVLSVALTGALADNVFDRHTPRLRSEVQPLSLKLASQLLEVECGGSVVRDEHWREPAFGCKGAPKSTESESLILDGVIFGHFLSPQSEDAILSGFADETHPLRWGGTLLLTKKDGKWSPVWYKSAVITRRCMKLTLPNHRDILLCEDEDGGMGHSFHQVFIVDPSRPLDIFDSWVLGTDSFGKECAEQRQEILSVSVRRTTDGILERVVVLIQHSHRRPRNPPSGCAHWLVKIHAPPPGQRTYRIELVPQGDVLTVSPRSRNVARYFGWATQK